MRKRCCEGMFAVTQWGSVQACEEGLWRMRSILERRGVSAEEPDVERGNRAEKSTSCSTA